MNKPAFIILHPSGIEQAKKFAQAINGDLYVKERGAPLADIAIPFDNTVELLETLFLARRPILFMGSLAILMRALAPFIHNKHDEAPAISLSQDGKTIIPLLGLHHGGLDLAKQIAKISGGSIAATNVSMGEYEGLSLESPPQGWALHGGNDQDRSHLLATLAHDGGRAKILLDDDIASIEELTKIKEFLSPLTHDDSASVTITITDHIQHEQQDSLYRLYYCPRNLILGIGAIRGTDADALYDFVLKSMEQASLPLCRLKGLASIEEKEDELAIKILAKRLNLPFFVFSAEALAQEKRIKTPSDIVMEEMNTPSVAEAACLLLAGEGGTLILPKVKTPFATLAVARQSLLSDKNDKAVHNGKKVGKLSLVGLGPGPDEWRTPQASKALAEAETIVGYDYYLKLVAPLLAGKKKITHALGEEEARCRIALEEAAKGANVALISSGDIGIYAMAALVYELVDRPSDKGGVSKAAKRVDIRTIPGISAFQAASALAGAPMGHDFCLISLSDLMTPWSVIESRVEAAAKGDFVIAFYNPQSEKRRHQLGQALEIITKYRGWDTPIFVGRQCGRKDQQLTHTSLKELDVEAVDMLTILIIGSSQSRQLNRGDGLKLYTPRGYGDKRK